jgi:hypothetical protein
LYSSYEIQFEFKYKPVKIDLTEHPGGQRWLF